MASQGSCRMKLFFYTADLKALILKPIAGGRYLMPIIKQIFTLDAVVFHQLCTVYQHLRGNIIYWFTLEKTHSDQQCTCARWIIEQCLKPLTRQTILFFFFYFPKLTIWQSRLLYATISRLCSFSFFTSDQLKQSVVHNPHVYDSLHLTTL